VVRQTVMLVVLEPERMAGLASQQLPIPEALVAARHITAAEALRGQEVALLLAELALVSVLAAVADKVGNVAAAELEVDAPEDMAVLEQLEQLLFSIHPRFQMQPLHLALQVIQILPEQKLIHGEALGLLHGKPIRIKNIYLQGM